MAYTDIDKPSDYFNTKLYSGDGNTTQAITGVGFQPDFTWLKNRSDGTGWHRLSDGVRGVTKILYSNATNAEVTTDANGYIASFDSDGLTVNLGSSGTGTGTNSSGDNFVTWNWLADNTSGSSNTDGSITSTVSANTTSGFSIVSYTGTGSAGTIGHGLSSAPKMVIVKERSGADAWIVGHLSIGFTKNLLLNATNAEFADSTIWNNTAPTSSVFSVGSSGSTNQSTATYIAYCFAEIKGFSKFGSYTGNGSTDGTFVYTGFKPAWVMIKRTDSTNGWYVYDTTRRTFNQNNVSLSPNEPDAEDTSSGAIDILSNGFKLRNTDGSKNGSSNSYIYMALAENPFVTSTGIPTTAR